MAIESNLSVEANEITPMLKGESSKAYSAFAAYRDLGPGRTLDSVRHIPHICGLNGPKSKRQMQVWSTKWAWIERCRAYDARWEAIRLAARIKVMAQESALWETRRHSSLHRTFETAQELARVGREMLKVPIAFEQQMPDGAKELRPSEVRWSMRDAAAMIKVSVELEAAIFAAVERGFEGIDDLARRVLATAVADSPYPPEMSDLGYPEGSLATHTVISDPDNSLISD